MKIESKLGADEVRPGRFKAMSSRVPVRLQQGARVGVAALSGVVDQDRLSSGLEELRTLGFEPITAANLKEANGTFAGSDAARLDAFHELLADDKIDALWFARGGYGATRVLPMLDWDLIGERPRWFIGYSDLTPLLLEVERRFGWLTLHGPMVAADLADGLDEVERARLLEVLQYGQAATMNGRVFAGNLPVEGVLRGGCLSLLVAAVGTAYAPDATEILFLEDVNEPLYRLDRMWTQLEQSGALDRVRGVVVGCDPDDDSLWQELLKDKGIPYVVGLQAGHSRPNLAIPIGASATLHAHGVDFGVLR